MQGPELFIFIIGPLLVIGILWAVIRSAVKGGVKAANEHRESDREYPPT